MAAAEPFAVTGLVRNEPDGTVLLEAQGEQGEVDAFLASIAERMRPNIKGVSTHSLPLMDAEQRFRIDR